jgi:hypothetical protein
MPPTVATRAWLAVGSGRTGKVAGVLETVFLILLAAAFGLVAWSSGYAVYRTFVGQR